MKTRSTDDMVHVTPWHNGEKRWCRSRLRKWTGG